MKSVREPVNGIYLNIHTIRVISGKWCVKALFNYRYRKEPDYYNPNWRTLATFETRELAMDFAEKLCESWRAMVVSND